MIAAGQALAEARYVSLATFRRNGVAVYTPVWIAAHGECLYVFSAPDAGKIKRLRNNDAVRLATCNFRGALFADEWCEGRAEIVHDAATIAAAHRALIDKYGWQMRLGDFFSRLSGRLDKRAWLAIDLEI